MAAAPRPLDVHHVATLASLTLSREEEAKRFEAELGAIVAYVAQLGELDTRDVPPTAHVQLDHLALRQDAIYPGLTREEALSQAPAVEGDGFAVPTFVE